jgi:hypothetical protein
VFVSFLKHFVLRCTKTLFVTALDHSTTSLLMTLVEPPWILILRLVKLLVQAVQVVAVVHQMTCLSSLLLFFWRRSNLLWNNTPCCCSMRNFHCHSWLPARHTKAYYHLQLEWYYGFYGILGMQFHLTLTDHF